MKNLREKTRFLTSRFALAALVVAAFMAGCGKSERNVPSGTSGIPNEEPLVELTYPQSDPDGHYVALSEPGTYAIEGTVASREPVRKVSVNGVEVVPYRVEDYPSYNTPENIDVYRFRAPLIWQPETRWAVRVTDPPLAQEYLYSPDTNATVSYWQQAAKSAPSDAGLLYQLENSLFGKSANDVIRPLTTALLGKEQPPWSLYQLGKAYLTAGKPAEALNPLNRASAAYPTFADAQYDRGVAYYDLKRYDQAAANLTTASKLVPDWAEPLVALGQTYYAQNKLQKATDAYTHAGTIWPTWSVPEYSLAMVRLDEGRMKDATMHLDRAEELGPWRATHHEQLAEKLFAKGNNVAAWRQVQIAQKLGGEPSQDFLNRLGRKMPEPPGKPMWWTDKSKDGKDARKEPPGQAKEKKEKKLKSDPHESPNSPAAKQPPGQARKTNPGTNGSDRRENSPGTHGNNDKHGSDRKDNGHGTDGNNETRGSDREDSGHGTDRHMGNTGKSGH